MDENRLAKLISDFVQSTPSGIIQSVVSDLEDWDEAQTGLSRSNLLASIYSPHAKSKLIKLLDAWERDYHQLPAIGLALAIRSSLISLETAQKPAVELTWTGPSTSLPLRRTDQALLELIDGAKQRLIVVSFAVYKAQTIIDAIENALRRDVEVIICLEDAEESQGKVSFSGSRAFSSSVFRLASFYCWPIENRPHTDAGRFGSLHAKAAVADRARVFISSANLTEYAMDMNLEMGVFVDDNELGKQIDDLFSDLIIRRVFREIAL